MKCRHRIHKTTGFLALVGCLTLARAGGPGGLPRDLSLEKQRAVAVVDTLHREIRQTAMEVWRQAETALQENNSSALLQEKLSGAGFSIQRGMAGMPTAFSATYGQGRPVIGILAEYDALPGIGNEPGVVQKPRADGVTSGHGCGHNLLGTAAVYGAIALKTVMAERNFAGTIVVFGTPAEETLVGKAYMARDGVFGGLDVCIEWHPDHSTGVRNTAHTAMNSFTVEFSGVAAHAAASPWEGRSALDAVELMNAGVNMLREHIPTTARIHYVITDGGAAPNIVPAKARAWYFLRDQSREALDLVYQRVLRIAEGAALMTGTTQQIRLETAVYPFLFNRPLQAAMQRELDALGSVTISEEDQDWGRQLQRELGLPPVGYSAGVRPLADKSPGEMGAASSDVGDVSHVVPTVGFTVGLAPTAVPGHGWGMVAVAASPVAIKSAEHAARLIGVFGVELLTNPNLLRQSREHFQRQVQDHRYRPVIPQGQLPARH